MGYISELADRMKIFFDIEDGKKYIGEILSGKRTILVNLDELEKWDANLSGAIINEATKYGIKAFEEALKEASRASNVEVGFYGDCIPFVKVHEISSKHIGKMIKIRGLVNRTHFIKPMAIRVVFKCRECGIDTIPILQESPFALTLPFGKCEGCGASKPKYDVVEELSDYIDSQEFSVQEAYEDVSGRIPQRLRLITHKKYLINKVYCGDLVEIAGVVKLIPEYRRHSKSRFNTPYMEVHHIKKRSKDPESIEISKEEEEKIIELSKKPNIYSTLVRNVAPSLYGMKNCKEASLLSLFGGVTKHRKDITVRGNIHTFFIGDPATAKSQLLRAVAELSPRGMFSSGRGATAAGLTASLNKDENGEWIIEAGVLVLADKGVACVDEIDKMRKEDRVNIHEAMASQIVCYDDQTEVLTDEGWKLFKDLNKNEFVITLNLETDEIEYQKPTEYFEYDYEGQMFGIINSRKVDLVVTPNHNLLVSYYKHHNDYNRWGSFELVVAERTFGKYVKYKRDGKWFGKRKKYFILPSIIKKINQYKQITMPEIKIPMDLWLEFFGYYIAEGHAKPYYTYIAQTENTEKWRKIKNCLEKFPFEYSYKGNNFIICDKQLATYLMKFGHSPQKYLPKEIKMLSSKQLKTLLDAMMLGDGNKQKTVYYTTSFRLADDVQELLLKTGLSGNIKNRKTKSRFSIIDRRIIKSNYNELEVRFIHYNQPQIGHTPSKGKKSGKTVWIDYSGKVYCVEVPNHVIYVRRNGKPVWSGNSINKAGIHSTLMARTAVIAAANPTLGNYDRSKSVFENLSDFPPALFSRFDLIFILIDKPKDEFDRKVAEHIANNDEADETIDRELFKKYIAYAKRINPTISKEAKELLMEHFLSIRKRMSETWTEETTPITFRQFEALIRLCEAHARILLKEEADVEDAEDVIKIFNKFLSDISFDIGTLEGGPSKSSKEYALKMVRSIVLNKQTSDGVGYNAIIEEAITKGISKPRAEKALKELINSSSIHLVSSDGMENYYRTSWF